MWRMQGVLAEYIHASGGASGVHSQVDSAITGQTADLVGNTESFITQLVSAAQAVNSQSFAADLPVIGQVVNGAHYIDKSAQAAVAQLQQLHTSFTNAYCTPAIYTPSAPVPANLTGVLLITAAIPLHVWTDTVLSCMCGAVQSGPGFSLTFSAGNCTFDPVELQSKDGAIQCVGPSVTLDKTPAIFTSGYESAATFTGEVQPPPCSA